MQPNQIPMQPNDAPLFLQLFNMIAQLPADTTHKEDILDLLYTKIQQELKKSDQPISTLVKGNA